MRPRWPTTSSLSPTTSFGVNAGLGYGGLGEQTNLQQQQLGEQSNLAHQQLGQHALDQQAQYELAQQQMQIEAAKANQAADLEKDGGIIGMVGSVIGGAAMSDERSKKEIQRLETRHVVTFIGARSERQRRARHCKGCSGLLVQVQEPFAAGSQGGPRCRTDGSGS